MNNSTARSRSIERRAERAAALAPIAVLAMLMNGCRAIGDIFKAGIWVGIVAIVAVLAIAFGLLSIFRRTA